MQNAWSFDRLRTMRSYGMRPWLKLMADRRLAEFVAERHRYEREARRAFEMINMLDVSASNIHWSNEPKQQGQFINRLISLTSTQFNILVNTLCVSRHRNRQYVVHIHV